MSTSETTSIAQLTSLVQQLMAEVRLLSAKVSAPPAGEQWLSLDEAYPRLAIKSKRALQRRIEKGSISPDCLRAVPSSTQKTSTYLINIDLYLSKYAKAI